ncbi:MULTISPECIES: hypothetical protein [Ochrobactrum]|uniref:Uncharacterized protein n=1 Tax=Ochrobactrum chromiisoli TaxID=2993941 RepID=A0ABT3QIU3_9HYPH|nr:hypothetical protein [Ochrobactrum chromiisoli]MCX2695532.1 hypothetical protein [Ochrobactrum chromiisoli]
MNAKLRAENELAVAVRGYHNGHITTLKNDSPERGMRLSLTTGIQRGTGQKTGDQHTVDELQMALQLWLFKGI